MFKAGSRFFRLALRRRTLVVALAAIYGMGPQLVQANPGGAAVVNGQATLQTQGNTLTVTNTPGAIIHWQQFSVKAGETTIFKQQNAASTVFNRVLGQNPALRSEIDGTLGSNGRVFLINPNGIVFGAGSVIDTQGFVASTLSLNDEDIKAGKFKFARDGMAGDIQVQGRISSGNGDVYLIAPNVGVDGKAVITSQGGNVVLAAGEMVEITGRNLNDITFEVQNRGNEVVNLGKLEGGAVGVFAGTLRHSGVVQAQTLAREGGRLVLKAQGDVHLAAGSLSLADGKSVGGTVSLHSDSGNIVVDTGAVVSARASAPSHRDQATTAGGSIALTAQAGYVAVDAGAQLRADGGRGGSVQVKAAKILQDGAISADGDSSLGGTVRIEAKSRVIQAATATVTANGVLRGGDIVVQADTAADGSGHVFSSATLDASASTGVGGSVTVTARDMSLAAAQVHADGDTGGGVIRLGGGSKGGDSTVANATNLTVNKASRVQASARVDGDGGSIMTWADASNRFAAEMQARGGAAGGNGGTMEVSAKQEVQLGSTPDAGAPMGRGGNFIIDPKYILIQATVAIPGVSVELLDPNPGSNDLFGQNLQVLTNGNILVFDSNDDFAATNAGAIYMYDGTSGALLSNLRGTAANDRVGSGGDVRTLTGGKLLLSSPLWSGSAGALTTFDSATGVSGALSSVNSLVGSAAGDQIGSRGTTTLSGGTLAIYSPNWNSAAGAITWADGSNGITGVVSSANSLVGALASDRVGNSNVGFGSSMYYVATSAWNGNAGAVTWINPAAPTVGVVGAANSLVGANPGDQVGSGGIQNLLSGKWTVFSPDWNGTMGAVTWMDHATGLTGTVGAANSLVGSTAGDRVGSGFRDFVGSQIAINSPDWSDGGAANGAGAITWFSNSSIVTGVLSASNSLVGSNPGDRVGDHGVDKLDGTHYVIINPSWNTNSGAVTWIDTNAPVVGVVSAANSLVGSTSGTAAIGDRLGSGGVENLGSGKTAVFSPRWSSAMGAVSWLDTAAGSAGIVDATNSLVGSTTGDAVGGNGEYRNLGGSRVAIISRDWASNANTPAAGAVTWVDASNGLVGAVSAANSLVGSNSNDRVGSGGVIILDSTHYALVSSDWNGLRGAVTWIDRNAPVVGAVTAGNSLVGGSAGDRIGDSSVDNLGSGKTLVFSTNWGGSKGAVTWLDNTVGTFGVVDAMNSLVGSNVGDRVGDFGNYDLFGGKVAIISPAWANAGAAAAGAITWADPAVRVVGAVSDTNSLVGSFANDGVGVGGLVFLDGVHHAARTTAWNSNTGAVTWIDSAAPVVGAVSSANSLVGDIAGDQVGGGGFVRLSGSKSLVLSPAWHANKGAVTWFDHAAGTKGIVDATNSLVGSTGGSTATGDRVGGSSYQNLGNLIALRTPNWNNGAATLAGAVTFADPAVGVVGPLSAANSLVGSSANDRVGLSQLPSFFNGNYYLSTTAWNSSAGAVTFVDSNAAPLTGAMGAANSLVGATAGDLVGGSGVQNLFNGKVLVRSPGWNNGMGAVTWFSTTSSTVGVVSAANSLVGSTAGDGVGSSTHVSAGSLVGIRSPNWDNGIITDAGAITWADEFNGITGLVSAANSLIGAAPSDRIGQASIDNIASGLSAVRSTTWGDNTGAVTWINHAAPMTGVVSPLNSLVGSATGDQVGSGGFSNSNSGTVVLRSNSWSGNRGAVTWIDPSAPVTGLLTPANSLVGANANDFVGNSGVGYFSNGDYYVRSTNFNGAAGAVSIGRAAGGISGVVSGANSLIGQNANDGYGGFVSIMDGNRLLVHASDANSGGFSDNGRVHIYVGGAGGIAGPAGALGGQAFSDNSTTSVTISPAQITAITNTGTSVILQANSDITLDTASDIVTNNPSGDGGSLTMQAGRSVNLYANILTDNGNLLIIANELTSNGVLTAQREPGLAEIVMANGTRIDAGTGTVNLHLRDGTGRTGLQALAGTIRMRSISAGSLVTKTDTGSVLIGNLAATAPSEIVVLGNADIIAKTSVSLLGGNSGAQALLSANGQVTIASPNPELDPAPLLTLTNGGSSARIVNPPATLPLVLSGSECIGCTVVSDFEIAGGRADIGIGKIIGKVDSAIAALLSMVKPPFNVGRKPDLSKLDNEDDIAVDSGEICQ